MIFVMMIFLLEFGASKRTPNVPLADPSAKERLTQGASGTQAAFSAYAVALSSIGCFGWLTRIPTKTVPIHDLTDGLLVGYTGIPARLARCPLTMLKNIA